MFWRSALATLALFTGIVLVLPVLVIAVVFASVAGLTKLAAASMNRGPKPGPWRDLVEYEPVIGWKPRANLDAYAMADEVFHLTTGPDGWRGQLPLQKSEIVVFGDSFAFGHGANDHEMYSQFCNGLRVKPIGSDGYNMVHGLLWMRRLASGLAGKLVIWFVYYGNDLHESLLPNMGKYRMPYVRQRCNADEWEVVSDHVGPEPWPFRSPTSYHPIMASYCCGTALGQRIFSAADFLLSEAHELCSSAGAQLSVVGIPDRVQLTRRGMAKLLALAPNPKQFNVNRPDEELSKICVRLGVPFEPLSAVLTARDYLLQDIHWRKSGHRKVGRILNRLYEQNRGSLPPQVRPTLAHSADVSGRSAQTTAVIR